MKRGARDGYWSGAHIFVSGFKKPRLALRQPHDCREESGGRFRRQAEPAGLGIGELRAADPDTAGNHFLRNAGCTTTLSRPVPQLRRHDPTAEYRRCLRQLGLDDRPGRGLADIAGRCGFGLGRDGLFDYLEVRERAEVVSQPPRNVGDPPGVVGDPLTAAAGSCELVQGRPEVTPGFV
jgi:hypothetical protein